LAAVKTEFSKFGAALESVKKKLHTASTEIDQVGTRSRVLERKLRNVECLPDNAAPALPDAEGESPTANAED
jgi:DNA recombination protein RmuC